MKYHFLLLFLLFSFYALAQSPKFETRAVWLTTIGGIDWPHSYKSEQQKEELRHTLDLLQRGGVNTVLLQTRIRATTIFPSDIEPWDGCLSGTPSVSPGYDALQFAIDECHKRGMQLHAWVVTIPVGKWNKTGCVQLRKKYPKLVRKIGDEGYLNPEQPATTDYLVRCCKEIVQRYDVDGVHLDYIRYPETWPKAKNAAVRSERRSNITRIVRAIYQAVKELKPWVMVSCAPIGKHDDLSRYRSNGWNAHSTVGQDAQQWLKEGIMDALFPMMYFRGNQFFPFAIDWQENSYGRLVVPGLGIYMLDPREGRWTLDEVKRQLNVTRQLGMGHCYFRSKFFTDNVKGIYDFGTFFDSTPSLVSPMTWMGASAPSSPTTITLVDGKLKWGGALDRSGAPYLLYNVYAADEYPVDISQSENLIATRLQTTSLQLPANRIIGKNFAVTAVNRYGQESDAVQLCQNPASALMAKSAIIHSSGEPIELPSKGSTLDADFVVVETLTGQTIDIFPYAKMLSVNSFPDGMYRLRSLHKKGRNHRIGYFIVKR